MKITVLGSGTSSGVPTVGCNCPACISDNPKDKRLRASILLEAKGTVIVIDTSPDFRQQLITNKISDIDAVLYTHYHFDHIGGFDDLRAINYSNNKRVPIFINDETFSQLKRTFLYAFEKPIQMGGGVPLIDINFIDTEKFSINGIEITPIPLKHGILDVLGFRIGNFAYCTDVSKIPEDSYSLLNNLDVLIIDALRNHPHPTHFSVNEALREIQLIKPQRAYLTHIAHQLKHEDCERELSDNIFLAYDGLEVNL